MSTLCMESQRNMITLMSLGLTLSAEKGSTVKRLARAFESGIVIRNEISQVEHLKRRRPLRPAMAHHRPCPGVFGRRDVRVIRGVTGHDMALTSSARHGCARSTSRDAWLATAPA